VHSRTTAIEILEDFRDDRLDAWVTGYGSGGTLKGVGRVLRAQRPETKIFVCEPDNSQVLGSGITQARAADGSPAASHPVFRPHAMQGWAPDFIPKLAEDAIEQKLIDRVVPVNVGARALELARRLATEEGILAGISGGATLAGAIEVCKDLPDRRQRVVHAARHGRALLEHAVVRGHPGGNDGGRNRTVAIDAGRPVRHACADRRDQCRGAGGAGAAGPGPRNATSSSRRWPITSSPS
jgi:cysteine synthase